MLCPALPGVAETRPKYPRDVFRRYTAHDVAMQRGFELERTSSTRPRAVLSCRPPTDQMRNDLRVRCTKSGGGSQGSRSGRVQARRSPSRTVDMGGRTCREGGCGKQADR